MKTLIFGTYDTVRFSKEPLREPFFKSYSIVSSVGGMHTCNMFASLRARKQYLGGDPPGEACTGWLLSCWTVTVPGSVHSQKILCVAGSSRGHLHPVGGSL